MDWKALLAGKEGLIAALRKEKYQEVLEAAGVPVLRGGPASWTGKGWR